MKILKHNFYKNFSFFYAIYFLIVILFATTLVPIITTSSATTYWSSYKDRIWLGDGSEENPYIITTPGQLYYFSIVGGHGKLGTTLDLSAHYWDSPTFIGTFLSLDGDGKSILNLTFSSNSIYCGLIGYTNAKSVTIKFSNLSIDVGFSSATTGSYTHYFGSLVGV